MSWDDLAGMCDVWKLEPLCVPFYEDARRIVQGIKPQSARLDDLLSWFTYYQCEKSHDRVYGLLGLVDWTMTGHPPLEPDYSISVWQLAVKMVRYIELSTVPDLLGALRVDARDGEMQNLVRSLPLRAPPRFDMIDCASRIKNVKLRRGIPDAINVGKVSFLSVTQDRLLRHNHFEIDEYSEARLCRGVQVGDLLVQYSEKRSSSGAEAGRP